jgi:hypothetical protein
LLSNLLLFPLKTLVPGKCHGKILCTKDIDPKKVTLEDTVMGDWPSVKASESGKMVKPVATICGMDAMSLICNQK